MVRTLASLFMCVLAGAFFAGPLAAQSVVGAWYFGDTRSDDSGVVVFLDNGYYFHIVNATPGDAPAGFDGFERGTYGWNPATGAFTATTLYNGDGDLGLSDLSGVSGHQGHGERRHAARRGLGRRRHAEPRHRPQPDRRRVVLRQSGGAERFGLVVFLLDGTTTGAADRVAMPAADVPVSSTARTRGTRRPARSRRAAARRRTSTPMARGVCPIRWPADRSHLRRRQDADGDRRLAERSTLPRVGATYVAPAPVPANTAVEYYHADFEHYFVTSLPTRSANLDAGRFHGWARTGQTFKVFPLGDAGYRGRVPPVLRSVRAAELALLHAEPRPLRRARRTMAYGSFEGDVFGFRPLNAACNCHAGTVPLYPLLQQQRRRGAEPPLHDQPACALADDRAGVDKRRATVR